MNLKRHMTLKSLTTAKQRCTLSITRAKHVMQRDKASPSPTCWGWVAPCRKLSIQNLRYLKTLLWLKHVPCTIKSPHYRHGELIVFLKCVLPRLESVKFIYRKTNLPVCAAVEHHVIAIARSKERSSGFGAGLKTMTLKPLKSKIQNSLRIFLLSASFI